MEEATQTRNTNVSMVLNLQDESSNDEKSKVPEDVTSRAVIQFKEQDLPVPYRQLKEDTNLNLLPETWLKTNLSGNFCEKPVKKKDPIDLSSFRMANSYLDHVGNVDVISDAENIKRLLKTPYSDTGLSMAVHRIRNTLLINELDIPKVITAASQNADLGTRLDWLKHLYCEVLGISQDSNLKNRKGSIEEDISKTILSKFLHHSVSNAPSLGGLPVDKAQKNSFESDRNINGASSLHKIKNLVPEFSNLACSEAPEVIIEPEPAFQRDVLWNLDDISMLVGSNMPIFGGGMFPVVSLRLRDAMKPINILTGLDYWLDNLMCNVPELVMCYHLEGIVKKYEVVSTEDLPSIEDCQFSPKVVKDIAQDILSFLKSKCTKEGHTYWLFKGSKSDIVKLYDLTSICNENAMENCLNPFTFPVASLLCRIARNMIANGIRSKKDAIAACSLLQNCIILLEKENHPELILSANFLLAQLYMQEGFPDDDDFEVNDNQSYEDESVEDKFSDDGQDFPQYGKILEPTSVSLHGNRSTDPGKAWLDSTREEKCRATIKFVIKALDSCSEIFDETSPNPMPVSYDVAITGDSITESKGEARSNFASTLVARNDRQLALETRFRKEYGLNFESNLRARLECYAISSYASLAEISIGKKKYGRALKFIKIAFICSDNIPSGEKPVSLLRTHAKLGIMAGDICLIFAHKGKFSYEDYVTLNEQDAQFVSLCTLSVTGGEKTSENTSRNSLDDIFQLSSENLLIKAVSWYENSLTVSPSDDTDQENVQQILAVTARLGNVRNELGVFYMNLASSLMKSFGEPSREECDLWKKSYQYFEKGIEAFSVTIDKQNMALLHSNAARLMRLCAQAYGNSTRESAEENRGEFTAQERLYFNKSFEFYQNALACLRSKAKMPEIWYQISNDLSGAYFIMACTLQDHAPLSGASFEEVSKEVQNLMMKALHYCHDEENLSTSPRYKVIRSRMGKIHHRIASLYQHSLRNKGLDDGTKKLKSLSEMHYYKAYTYLHEDNVYEYLTMLTEHIALHTQVDARSSSAYTNVKRLKTALVLLLKEKSIGILRSGVKLLNDIKKKEKVVGKCGDNVEEKRGDEIFMECFDCTPGRLLKTLSLLEKLLSNVLKDLVMTFSRSTNMNIVEKLDLAESKRMYGVYLQSSITKGNEAAATLDQSISLFSMMADVIESIRDGSKLDCI